jgi:hypothetical protein
LIAHFDPMSSFPDTRDAFDMGTERTFCLLSEQAWSDHDQIGKKNREDNAHAGPNLICMSRRKSAAVSSRAAVLCDAEFGEGRGRVALGVSAEREGDPELPQGVDRRVRGRRLSWPRPARLPPHGGPEPCARGGA